MPEPREARSIIESAEQAAATGNYASAEDLLREAAALQEHTLGPHHPDLANTLNNLGVVCEITDNPIDAEHYFRRAHTIATAALPPDHPFVATSRKNLHDFCAARGRPVELPPAPPAVAAWLEAPAPAAPRRDATTAKTEDVEPILQARLLRPLTVGVLTGVALLIVILAVARPWSSPVEQTTTPPVIAIAPSREAAAPKPTPPPAEAIVPRQSIEKPAQPTQNETDAIAAEPGTSATSAVALTVASAQLCTALRNWQCETADSQVPPGPMIFYTQIKSATATTIEHRWYLDDRLHRTVQLRIEANPGAGYRTYSRNTISADRAGDWRVELRSGDGTVLHAQRFVVR